MSYFKKVFCSLRENMQNADKVLGMNRRNLSYIYPSNKRKYFQYTNNKLLTKETLKESGISVPETFMSVSYFYELQKLESNLRQYSSFVIKPSSGSGGNGIVVISEYKNKKWFSINGKEYNFNDIQKHIADIIFGVYSFGLNDTAIVEERIIQNEQIDILSPLGLADIRVINYKGSNVKAMLRIATKDSNGRANLHQGGVGVSINMNYGKTDFAQIDRDDISHHPDSNVELLNVEIPHWDEILMLCEKCMTTIPMEYLGIDVAISKNGPLILEVNARPGIEIQNISHNGMIEDLTNIDKKSSL